MKSLYSYILEANENIVLHDVEVTYTSPSDVIIQVPEKYSEDDIQIYLDDVCLKSMPSSDELKEKFFGKNAEHIIDAYFEYDKLTSPADATTDPTVEWNKRYDTSMNSKDIKLVTYALEGFRYILSFDTFELANTDSFDIKKTIEKVFLSTVSNEVNEYPIEIELDPKNIKFRK